MNTAAVQAKLEELENDARTWWQKFKDNVYRIWAYATAWATTLWAGVWAWWASMDKSDQVALVGSYISANKVPFVLAVGTVLSFVIAKGWPQPKLAATVEVKKDETEAKQVLDVTRSQR